MKMFWKHRSRRPEVFYRKGLFRKVFLGALGMQLYLKKESGTSVFL